MSTDEALSELQAADELLAAGDDASSLAARERGHEMLHAAQATTAVFDGDAETWRFGHEAPGPAGAATLHLAGGCTLAVDLADPSRLLGLSVPAPGAGEDDVAAGAVVGALIGPDAETMFAAGPGPDQPAMVPFPGAAQPPLRALARLAGLDRSRAIAEAGQGAWPLWAAEAAVLCARATAVPGCEARARAEAATCAETVLAVAEATRAGAAHKRLAELLPELRPLAASDADAALLRRAEQALSPAPRVGRARSRAGAGRAPARGMPAFPEIFWLGGNRGRERGSSKPGRRPSATFPVAPHVIPYGLTTRRARIYWEQETGELEVHCHTAAGAGARVGELWVRAFMPPELAFLDSAPLAIEPDAPLADDGLPFATARLTLPRGLDEGLIKLDITPEPAEPPAESRLGLTRRAREEGVAAVAAEHAGRYAEAIARWKACAELWEQAAATLQQTLAELYRAEALDSSPGQDGDAARAELERREPASAWRARLRREPAEPFLGELARRDDLEATG